MKILHTSDWHIGRLLYGRKRYDEFSAFLKWLLALIESENVDILLVSGDVFDTTTPSNRSQALYYKFLRKVSRTCCRHVVIIAGNHDSPSFLNAPRELLLAINIHVRGSITENPEDEVIVLKGPSNIPEAIIVAVPYLRDRDIRFATIGERLEDKSVKLVKGVQNHYAEVCHIAREQQKKCDHIPIIGMGHLFTTGGKTIDDDGVRELYVGSLAHVGKEIFPEDMDYLALGHLHIPQRVGKTEHIRYAGSPIPMGYGEAKQEKSVVIVEFKTAKNKNSHDKTDPLDITQHTIPCFQALERISGSTDDILQRISELTSQDSNAWLEIEYTGEKITGNLRGRVEEAVADTDMEIRRVKNRRVIERVMHQTFKEETLADLSVTDVFNRLLDTFEVAEDERSELIQAHQEVITSLNEEDTHAE